MKARLLSLFLFLGLVALGFWLRAQHADWDAGHLLHPDERHMAMVTAALDAPDSLSEWLNTDRSPFNPYNRGIHSYVYGTLPLRMVHALTVARGVDDLEDIARTGRMASALWSTGALLLFGLLTWRVMGMRWALAGTSLLALTVLSIQQAHFYTVDSAGVFFATLSFAAGVIAAKEYRPGLLLLAGASVGLAMACRLNLGLLAFWVAAAAGSMAWRQRDVRPLFWLVGGGAAALILFRLCQPYAFDASGLFPRGLNARWLRDVREVRAITTGELEVPYTLQWVQRTPWLYAIYNIAAWGLGWPLGLTALFGCLALAIHRRLDPGHWTMLVVLWPILLIGYHGGVFLHTMRYFLPAYPALILGGLLAVRAFVPFRLRRMLLVGVLLGTALYAAAFSRMYDAPHPRVEASRWLYEQLPFGGVVAVEHWDDALPLRMEAHADAHRHVRFLPLEVYHREQPDKIRKLVDTLARADVLVLSSTRASHSVPRMPMRYPVMTEFYHRLANNPASIGLREAARFQRSPRLGGWTLDSLKAEEAYRVYDHPRVRIYEKTADFDAEAVYARLTKGIDFDTVPDIRYHHAGGWNGGWLTPEQWERRQSGRSWSNRFPENGIGNRAPIPTWTLALFLLGPVSFPLCYYLFPSLHARGVGVGRLLVCLLVAWLAWFPAATETISFDHSLPLATLLVFAFSALVFGLRHEEMLAWLRRHWRRLVAVEAVWWVVFILFLALRLAQPDLWHPWAGGEKPMDFAFLNATVQTPFFPPPNPWLSGAFINYYYYGFVIVAGLIRLTGISPDLAYNLALPTFAAFAAGGAYTLATAFFPLFRTRSGRRGLRRAGLLAVGLTLCIGNLGQVRWLLEGRPGFRNAGYWHASRVIRVPEGAIEPITEFPFFSLLYGDLHAHLMALPVAMLCLLCSWQLFRRFHPLRLLVAAWILGTLYCVNAWDVPIQAAILVYCLFAPLPRLPSGKRLAFAWRRLGWALAALFAARMLYAPFHRRFLAPAAGIGFWDGPRSSLLDLFLAHGVFLVPLAAGAFLVLQKHLPRPRYAPWTARSLPLLLLAGCLLLIPLLEFVHLENDIGRMNTVFKFYYQVWWILAVLTAVVFQATFRTSHRSISGTIYCWACLLLIGCGMLYPLTAVPAKWKDRYWPTETRGLDGLAYQQEAVWAIDEHRIPLQDDRAAIRWLRQHATPFDVLMEAHRPQYQWGARLSWHTGLPTVLGWNWHMRQQRPAEGAGQVVWKRAHDIERFYTSATPEEAADLLRTYNVHFVAAGDLERLTYGDAAIDRLRRFPFLTPMFDASPTRIYAVAPHKEGWSSKTVTKAHKQK